MLLLTSNCEHFNFPVWKINLLLIRRDQLGIIRNFYFFQFHTNTRLHSQEMPAKLLDFFSISLESLICGRITFNIYTVSPLIFIASVYETPLQPSFPPFPPVLFFENDKIYLLCVLYTIFHAGVYLFAVSLVFFV